MNDLMNRMEIDRRDWNSIRERVCKIEEDMKQLRREFALFQQGVKERLDVFSEILAGVKNTVARKDVE